ncbi:sensor histidine kinase [Foetidibacter luteolus]|uniref:sensor histidine kinase n=1 Tax=Foetidibacter luteolus TaxID=2608880 RepID=UPI00129B9D24|nr:HAMP domain-containing sensor histidine kinase [Foetidibacter luteolus]
MMKFFWATALSSILCYSLKAQPNANQDEELVVGKVDTGWLNHQATIAQDIYLQNPDTAMAIAKRVLILSRKIDYDEGIGLGFSVMGQVYWAQAYNSISLFCLQQAATYLEKTNLLAERARCYRMLGRVNIDAGKIETGWAYLQRARRISTGIGSPKMLARVNSEIARYYIAVKQLDNAWEYAQQAMQYSVAVNDTVEMAISYSRMGSIMVNSGNYDAAKNYYDTSFLLNGRIGNKRLQCVLMYEIAALQYSNNLLPQAVESATAAIATADSIGMYKVKLLTMELMANCWAKLDSSQKRISMLQQLNRVRDSIDRVEDENSFNLLDEYLSLNRRLGEMERVSGALASKKEVVKYQRGIITTLVLFVLLLGGGLAAVYYYYRQKKKLSTDLLVKQQAILEQNETIEKQSQKLQELNQLKNKLFAVISHDLRTPVSNLKMMLDFFRRGLLTHEEMEDVMQKMVPLIDGTDLTLTNLLNWATSQMNGLKVRPKRFCVYDTAAEMKLVFEYALACKKLELHNQVSTTDFVFADPALIMIVLRNIVSNAVKFSFEQGSITISSESRDGRVYIFVQDNGKGIAEDDAKKLFKEATHFTSAGTSGEKGTGLGLLLCRDLILLNSGEIDVASTPGKKGSTFWFSLPQC